MRLLKRIALALGLLCLAGAGAFIYLRLTNKLTDNPLSWKIKKAAYLFQSWRTKAKPWLEMDYGPVIAATVTVGKPDDSSVDPKPGENIAYKGLAIRLTPAKDASILFDTEMLRYAGGWFGDHLVLTDTVYDGQFDAHPYVDGVKVFETDVAPGWANQGSFKDPRTERFGNLPEKWAKYRGLYAYGDKVVLSYRIGDTNVLDLPGFVNSGEVKAITRTLEVDPTSTELDIEVERVAIGEPARISLTTLKPQTGLASDTLVTFGGIDPYVAAVVGSGFKGTWDLTDKGHVRLKIPASPIKQRIRLYMAQTSLEDHALEHFAAMVRSAPPPEALESYTHGGPKRFGQTVVTKGKLGTKPGPYAVDDLTLPTDNPWKSWMRIGDIAFFSDDRAAMTTWSGDVWVVSGLSRGLTKLTWKRYATGFNQPLGLNIVDDVVYVLGRDQITRLYDLNGDGEPDYYENFNNDVPLTNHYHEFTFHMARDSDGNIYFGKGARHGLPANTKYQGTIVKLNKEGRDLEVVCSGIRVPNGGVALGPNRQITVSDQEGHWVPATRIDLCTPGSFHGYMWGGSVPVGRTAPDRPILFLPKTVDNSAAGQAWVDNARWGPFMGSLVHTSFGRSDLFLLMMEKVNGQVQGGAVRFPLEFGTGLLRAEFRPQDGQLYVCGLFGWGTRMRDMGGFYRVRYTGKPVYMPKELHVTKRGIFITFTQPLDRASAENKANYSCARWNYNWRPNYGSDQYKRDGQKGREKIAILSAKLQDDKHTVFLSTADMVEIDQMQTTFHIKAADGTPLDSAIYHTINALSDQKGEPFVATYSESAFAPAR